MGENVKKFFCQYLEKAAPKMLVKIYNIVRYSDPLRKAILKQASWYKQKYKFF